jgi:drug/metabolite transporter (DMT)-like permease
MTQNKARMILPFALGVAILAVSTASILIRLAQKDAPSITIAALRLTIAAILLVPVVLTRYRAELRSLTRHDILWAAASGGFLALHFGTWITSLEYTTVASSVVLVSTGPLWVALLSALVLRERMGGAAILGLALAITGGAVIAGGEACTWNAGPRCSQMDLTGDGRALWGDFLALAGAWAVSGYLVIGRHLRATISLVPYIFLAYGFAAIGLLIAALTMGDLQLQLPPTAYGWIILLAIVPQLVGHSTYNWALAYLPAAFVAVTTLGEPVGSAILAYVILHERPGSLVLAGAVLIMAGIYLSTRAPRVSPELEAKSGEAPR